MSNYLNKDDRNFYIYKMYDENDELLYIGKTTKIVPRMSQHFSKDMIKNQPWKEDVCYIKYFELYTKVDMDMTELYLIALERPKYNELSTDTERPVNNYKIKIKKHEYIIERKPSLKKINNFKEWEKCKQQIINNLNICQHEKLNKIGSDKYALSRMWYERQNKENGFGVLKNNIYNYFRHKVKGKSKENMYTTFEDYKNQCKDKGYSKGFVNSNCELNKFDNCKNFAYLMNKFPTDLEKENEEYANLLTIYDLIRIVKYITIDLNHKLNLYVPSERVRNLFINWLEE